MSWHRADWFASVAFVSAYGVVIFQDCRNEKRNKKRRNAVREAIVEITTNSLKLTNEIYGATASTYSKIGTWDQYRAFCARKLEEFHDLVAELSNQDIVESGLLDVAMNMRIHLRDMEAIVKESGISSPNWGQSQKMISQCKEGFGEIAQKLEIDPQIREQVLVTPANEASR